jgi:YVTN family beta-propeller protein
MDRRAAMSCVWRSRPAFVLIVLIALFGMSPPAVRADGGAPVVAYVLGAGASGRDLAVIGIAARKVVARVALDSLPAAIALRGDSQVIYVAEPDANHVLALDATTLRPQTTMAAGAGPDALVVDTAVTGNLFVADGASDTVTVLDVGTGRVRATVHVGAHPAGIAIAGQTSGIREAGDAEVYVAVTGANVVVVLSASSRQILATIPVPGGPGSVVVPATGGVAYVGTRSGTVVAVDVATHTVLGVALALHSGALGQMDYDAITGQIYIPDAAGDVVNVLRPVPAPTGGGSPTFPSEPAAIYALAGGPTAIAITSDGAYGFVTAGRTGRVAMVDVAAHQTLATIAVGGSPRAVVTGPYLPLVGAAGGGGAGISRQAILLGIVVFALVAFIVWALLAVLWWRGIIGRRVPDAGSSSET